MITDAHRRPWGLGNAQVVPFLDVVQGVALIALLTGHQVQHLDAATLLPAQREGIEVSPSTSHSSSACPSLCGRHFLAKALHLLFAIIANGECVVQVEGNSDSARRVGEVVSGPDEDCQQEAGEGLVHQPADGWSCAWLWRWQSTLGTSSCLSTPCLR